MDSGSGRLLALLLCLFYCFKEAEPIHCFNCSSVNDNFCPESMMWGDEGVVPYVPCDKVHDARFCIKTVGVNGGALGIRCFHCDDTVRPGCADSLLSAPLSDCSDVFDAYYCIKTIGVYGGSLGTTRFCSSRDMGNYCEYIRRPGDQLEYRSCVFTCSSDGCNGVTGGPGPTSAAVLLCASGWLILAGSNLWWAL